MMVGAHVTSTFAATNGLACSGNPYLDDLLPAFLRLDCMLGQAVRQAHDAYGAKTLEDRFRGLYVDAADATLLLSRSPGASLLYTGVGSDAASRETSRLAWLQAAFGLNQFEMDVILIALAPEVDLRYERLYAYLQDDVTRKWPTVDLVLNLLCASAGERLTARSFFAADARLASEHLIQFVGETQSHARPLLAQAFRLDEQITRLLFGGIEIDHRLAFFSDLIEPRARPATNVAIDQEIVARATALLRTHGMDRPLRLYLCGQPEERGQLAECLARHLGSRLLIADIARTTGDQTEPEQRARLLIREAWFHDAILFLEDIDALRGDDRSFDQFARIMSIVSQAPGMVLLGGQQPWEPAGTGLDGVVTIDLPLPDVDVRIRCWQMALQQHAFDSDQVVVAALAERFRLTRAQIQDAVSTAGGYAAWRESREQSPEPVNTDDGTESPGSRCLPQPTPDELFAAARAQSRQQLGTLARKVQTIHRWNDIVLPEESLAQLQDLCSWVDQRHNVLNGWGFGSRLALGTGVTALFTGPSGTGKSMAAGIIGRELQLDVFKIDLAGVVSKYIGETEKNLNRIFESAEGANAVLFFDEADALFGKRSEVRDSHDRYANIETSYLLQRMEQYSGVAILATNLRQNMDEAFTRRLQFIVEFPFPDEVERKRIWMLLFPQSAPRDDSVDFDFLARQYRLPGGNIKNIVLGGAFLAAAERAPIGIRHLIRAARREYQKMGKVFPEADPSALGDVRVQLVD